MNKFPISILETSGFTLPVESVDIDVQIRAYSQTTGNDVVKNWDMRGFKSGVISIAGSSLHTYQLEGSVDQLTWVPVRLTNLYQQDTDFPLVPLEFKPQFRDIPVFGFNATLPYMRIIRKTNNANNFAALFVISLSRREIDLAQRPLSTYAASIMFCPVAPVTSAADVVILPTTDANPAFTPACRYVLSSVSLLNSGATASEVQLLDYQGDVAWSKIIPAGGHFSETYPKFIPFDTGTDNKVTIKVITAGAVIHPTIHAIRVQA